nr:tandem-95 repeat protein [uncultured Aquabacterium sp.]
MAKSSAIAPGGVVSSLQGRAKVLRQGEDAAQALKVGDSVAPGDVILASAQTQIQIQGADGQATAPHDWVVASADGASAKAARPAAAAAPAARGDLDDVIGAIERGDEDAATAAGLTGGDGAAMGEGLRVDRVIEVVTPQAFSVAITDDGIVAEVAPTLPREDENDAPVFVDAPDANFDPATGRYSLVTNEDQSVSGRVQAGDPDGDPLTFGKGSDPQNGSVVVNPDGSYTYTPRADYNGPDSFTVTVSDGRGGTATALVEISVLPSNDPPKVDDPSADPTTGNYNVTTDEDTPVSGQVKATDADGDTLTYAKGSDPASGSVVVRADGTWTYTPNKDFNGSDKFTITVSDGKGGTVTSTINIGVTPVNDAPVVLNQTTTLSEEGLLGGHADNQGSSDTTNAREATGQLSLSDTEGQSVSFTLSGPAGLTSGGVAVTWSGQGTASSPLVGSANGKTVLSATVDASGQYKVTLLAPIDHADTTREDTRGIELTVTATDGANRSTSTLTVQVEDDGPLSGAQQIVTQAQAATQDTNLMLIIDTSGSMESRLADQTVNGLKAAIKTLIDRYDNLGDVKVQLVTFADGGKGQSMWLSVQDAKNLIGALTANGGTNYDAALAAARTAFGTPGKISGGVNVSYFITDGEPSRGKALDTTYDEVAWEGFLVQNKVDSYAIGTGTLTADRVANIEPVAFNGITGQEKAAVTLATNAELSTYLLDTVPVIQKGNMALLAGADGMQRIDAFSAVGQTGSSLDASGKVLTLQLKSGGTMQVNLQTGDFTLSQPKNAAAETFNYSVIDKDGDRGTGTLSLSTRNSTPEGTDNTVTLLEDGRHTFSTADFGFRDADAGDSLQGVRIDSLPANGHLSLNGVAVTPGQLISASALNQLVFTPAPNASGSQYAQFTFTVQDSRGTFDASPNTLKLSVTPVNDAPEAFAANSGHNLLGLVDLSVNPLLNLSKTQQVAVNDIDNNLVRIDVRVDALLSLGSLLGDRSSLTVSLDPALTQGLLITGSDSRHLVIQSIHPGGTIDVTQVNKLLATLHYDPADVLGLNVDLFPKLNITATDAAGASDTACVSSSIIAVGVDVQPVISTAEAIVTGAGEHVAQLGTEVFQWTLGDRATSGEHCVDTIHGFDGAARTAGGDVLDLRDLLSGEAGATGGQVDLSKLLSHLDFDTQSQPGSTVIHVSASGEFKADASGNSQSTGCDDQQQIVLANVDIRASLGLDAQASDHQIIAELMQRGKLLVDHS